MVGLLGHWQSCYAMGYVGRTFAGLLDQYQGYEAIARPLVGLLGHWQGCYAIGRVARAWVVLLGPWQVC